MLKEKDLAILDMYVHASIIDGCANTNVKYFKHNDLESLEHILKSNTNFRTKFVIVDGVYSMDGDIAKLNEICDLAEKYHAILLVDDSHATGFIGENGRGTPELCKVEGRVDILVSTSNVNNKMIITIEDNGIGMSSETTKHIFEKFYRAHSGNIHNVKGFGLGMSYVKRIVALHKGQIRVQSELDHGTTIEITLPVG
jgi:glycine/serine hydroxymethyltransferase